MTAPANLVALCLVESIGGVTLQALLDRFGDVESILAAPETELQQVPRVGPQTAAAIRSVDVARTAREMALWQAGDLKILTWEHPDYPQRLRDLSPSDRPPVLFVRGALAEADAQAVAIVGTRSPSEESRQLALALGFELARRGWTVISGLAWGVDLAAHQGAARAGRTVAVLGSGLRAPLPNAKETLAKHILEAGTGALLSEVHPDARPNPATLVARNRLISGLSRAVILVEAGEQSGSLYAAQHAIRQERTLFVVENGSAGNMTLLANGALPLPVALAEYDWEKLHGQLRALP